MATTCPEGLTGVVGTKATSVHASVLLNSLNKLGESGPGLPASDVALCVWAPELGVGAEHSVGRPWASPTWEQVQARLPRRPPYPPPPPS